MRGVGARDRQFHRLGASRQQQAVEGNPAAIGKRDLARARIDTGRMRLQPQVDAIVSVKTLRPQRDPVLGRGAGEIILGEIGPVDGSGVVVAEHDNAAAILLAAEHLGGGETCRSASNDHDLFRRRARAALADFRLLFLFAHEDLAAALFHRPAVERTQAGACTASPVRKSKQA